MSEILHPNPLTPQEALRDILEMYWQMAVRYGGFGHQISYGIRFPVLRYLEVEAGENNIEHEAELLRAGSAVALLATMYDSWLDYDVVEVTLDQKNAVLDGRLSEFPDIEAVAREALGRAEVSWDVDPWFDALVKPIYETYVAGYFRRLADGEKSA